MKLLKKTIILTAFALTALNLSPNKAEGQEIYLVRGGFDVFSVGMNQMANDLKAKGLRASAHGIMGWKGIANDLIKRSKEKKISYPIVFLGHSLGADVAPDFASYLGQNGVTVDLIIAFDPTANRTFRGGVKEVINYRTSTGGRYLKGEGFRGNIREVNVSDYGANHFNIEKVDQVQKLALAEVLKKMPRRRRR